MRFKPVPDPPADLADLETVLAALPEPDAAGGVDDCCARLVDRTSLGEREEAATWLTFLRALDLVQDGPAGYARRESAAPTDPLERDPLRRAFRERVAGAAATLEALETIGEPAAVSEVVRVRRRSRPESRRRAIDEDRTRRLLEWAVLLGLAVRTDGGYQSAAADGG